MNFLETSNVRCLIDRGACGKPVMSHNRYVATCFAGDVNIGGAMVASLATDATCAADEAIARAQHLGLHDLEFNHPDEYRRLMRERTKCTKADPKAALAGTTRT